MPKLPTGTLGLASNVLRRSLRELLPQRNIWTQDDSENIRCKHTLQALLTYFAGSSLKSGLFFAVSLSHCLHPGDMRLPPSRMKPEEVAMTRSANRRSTVSWNRAVSLLLATILLNVLTLTGCFVIGVRIDPRSLVWGSVALGSTGNPKAVTLSNIGTSPIAISSIGFSGANAGDFAISSKTCGASLAASSSCTVTTDFHSARSRDPRGDPDLQPFRI